MSRAIPSLLAVTLALACASPDPWLRPAALNVPIERAKISELGGVGLSGSALDGEGRLWAVAERERMMVAILRRQRARAQAQPVPIRGVPEGLEAESLAWLGGNRFAIGTEQRGPPRREDLVLLSELRGAEVIVTGSLRLDYRALWGIFTPDNQGIEGLCAAGGQLVAAGETVIREGGRRFAPVARRAHDEDEWVPHLVELTSHHGRLAALDCWTSPEGDALTVIGVERHYGVMHLIQLSLPLDSTPRRIRAHVLQHLDERFTRMPNVEGVVRVGYELVLVTDHDSLQDPGTTESIRIGPFIMDDELEDAEVDD